MRIIIDIRPVAQKFNWYTPNLTLTQTIRKNNARIKEFFDIPLQSITHSRAVNYKITIDVLEREASIQFNWEGIYELQTVKAVVADMAKHLQGLELNYMIQDRG